MFDLPTAPRRSYATMHQILLWVGLLEIFSSIATIQVLNFPGEHPPHPSMPLRIRLPLFLPITEQWLSFPLAHCCSL